jgi:hypothetical protein
MSVFCSNRIEWLESFAEKSSHTRIVKLSGLPDTEATTTNDNDFLDVDQVLSVLDHSALQVCFWPRSFFH